MSEHHVPSEKMGPKCICPPEVPGGTQINLACPIHGVPRLKKRPPNCICLVGKSPSTDCPVHGEPPMGFVHTTPVPDIGIPVREEIDSPFSRGAPILDPPGVGCEPLLEVVEIRSESKITGSFAEDSDRYEAHKESTMSMGKDVFAKLFGRIWNCAHCDFVSTNSTDMANHLRTVHMGGVARQATYNHTREDSVLTPCPECKEAERVNHPAHYGGAADPYEHIKVVDAWKLNYRLGNATKYICRAGRKPGADNLEDLRKALWYLQSEIESREKS